MTRYTEAQYAKLARGEKIIPTEHEEQVAFFQWWRQYAGINHLPECLCFAIPNASDLTEKGRIWKWQEGLTAGAHDIFLSVPRGKYHGLYIEMKRRPNDLSAAQRIFRNAVEQQGYDVALEYTGADAINTATAYLELPSPS